MFAFQGTISLSSPLASNLSISIINQSSIISRNVVYFNYVDFAAKSGMLPVNAASFGKIIRQLFQNLTTRRLGTRCDYY